ncbi:MAG: ferritin-like protein [Alphaproteobacteria bacterium]|nr:ferritin-like protein [Alphaproteobacteria bacterium]
MAATKSSAARKQSTTASKTTQSKTAAPKTTANKNQAPKSNDSLLREFFVDCLRDMYWAEKYLVKTLPKMKKAATSPQLQAAFDDHTKMTETHIQRLEQVFELAGEKARAKKCEAMDGIVEEGKGIIEDTEKGTLTRDVGLILAAQKVEHYEIASYGGIAQLARTLGEDQIAEILATTLEEEKQTDLLLTQIAENDINYEASAE